MTQYRQDPNIEKFKGNIRELREGRAASAHIADLPDDVARQRKVPREIFIDTKAIDKIERKHRVKVDDKFIENLAVAETLVFYRDDPAKINFIKKLSGDRFFLVGTRRFNNHYVVTGVETSKASYIKSVKKRGEVINIAGRTPLPSIAQPSEEDRRQRERISGVGNITTSPKPNNNIQNSDEKVKGFIDEKKQARKSKKGGFTL